MKSAPRYLHYYASARRANDLNLDVNTKQMTEDDGTFHHPTFFTNTHSASARRQVVSGMVVNPRLPQKTDAKRRCIGEGRFPAHFFLNLTVHSHLNVGPSPLGG